jgi:hypothetical protein
VTNSQVDATKRGSGWRPWGHVAGAFVVGTVLSWISQSFVVAAFFGLLVVAVIPVILAAVLYGLLGYYFRGGRAGLWWAFTALVWIPGFAAAFALSATVHSGGYDPTLWWTALIAGVLPAAVTALGYAGASRVAGASLLVVAAAGGITFAAVQSHSQSIVDAKVRFGSTVRPYVTKVVGDRPAPDAAAALGAGPGTVSVAYYPVHVGKNGQLPMKFDLLTEAKAGPVCGSSFGVFSNLPETSCTRSGTIWKRNNPVAHEVAEVMHGHLIRVVGPISTPDSVLRTALEHARPMTDHEYNATLFPTD